MKYSPDQLRAMALEVLAARAGDDLRWLLLLINLSNRTGMHPDAVIAEIERLAEPVKEAA